MTSTTNAKMPEVRGLPIVGVGHKMMGDPMRFFEEISEQTGPIQRVRMGGQNMIFLHSAELIEEMLLKNKDDFGMSESNQAILDPLLGNSIPVTTDVLHWENLHATMLPMFTPRMISKYFEATRDAIAHEVELLSKAHENNEPVLLYDFIRGGVFHALTKTLFKDGVADQEIPELLHHFTNQSHYMSARYLLRKSPLVNLWPKARSGKASLDVLNARIEQLIQERRAMKRDEPQDMLDVFIQATDKNGQPLSDQVIRENTMALFFGGQETTPGSITWAFGLIAANPDKRDRMLAEIDEVLGGRTPEFQDLNRLKYVEMVLDEAMRLYPMFPFVDRQALTDTKLGEFDIEKGASVGFVGWTTHRDPKHWPNPNAFEPERHSPENRKGRARCSLVSFGYGKRRCLGERVGRMESVLMLTMISQKFLLNHPDGQLPEYVVRMSPKPRNGMPVEVVRRSSEGG